MTLLNAQARHHLLKMVRFLCDARRVSLASAAQDLHEKLQKLLSQKICRVYLKV